MYDIKFAKKYFHSLKPHLRNAVIIFGLSFFLGVFSAHLSPDLVDRVLGELGEMVGPLLELPDLHLFLIVFLNNGFKILAAALLGLFFAIFPVFFIFSNGLILGVISYSVVIDSGILFLLAALLPHGSLELPAAIIAASTGLMLGDKAMGRFFRGEKHDLKEELKSTAMFVLKFLVPIIFIAAFVEIYITFRILDLFVVI